MAAFWSPHVTVATVIEHAGKFLLVQEETVHGLRLNQPAGHLEPHETPAQGAVRETLEETGLHVQLSHFLGVYLGCAAGKNDGEITTYVRLAFIGQLATASHVLPDAPLDEGIVARLWLSADELSARLTEHRSPLVMACVNDYLQGRRLPLETVYSDASLGALGVRK